MLEKLRKDLKQLEIVVENIKNHIKAEQDKLITNLFSKIHSSLERLPLFEELNNRILDLNGVSFRTTENSIAYQVEDQNFLAVYPQVNALRIEYLIPEGWGNCKLIDDAELDGVMVLIVESCSLMRQRKK